ncbi:unnamed protein product, partial [Didymodactylos carnosus]
MTSLVRFACISDTHNEYDFPLPDADILLHSGDFTRNGTQGEVEIFLNWLKTLTQYRLKIIIVGNHESKRFHSRRQRRPKEINSAIEQLKSNVLLREQFGIVYLQDQSFTDPQ